MTGTDESPTEVTELTGKTGTPGPAGTGPDVSLTTAAAAELVGVTPRTIRRWIEKGTLPVTVGAGGVFYVFAQDVHRARQASLTRTPGTSHVSPRPGVVEDNNTVPDVSRTPGTSADMRPDPAGDAAGAILVAWRDTVLAPVVEELSATRRELGQVRQELGRLEAERDHVTRERDALRAELTAAREATPTMQPAGVITGEEEPLKPSADTMAFSWRRWWRRVTGGG